MVATLRARSGGVNAVPPVPVAGGVVAVSIAVPVPDPAGGTALGTVGHWPRQVHLSGRGEGVRWAEEKDSSWSPADELMNR